MLKFTLIPEGYFSQDQATDLLSRVAVLEKTDSVQSLELPCYKAVLLYAGADADARQLADMLAAAAALDRYNKVVVHLGAETVDIVLAAGDKLLGVNFWGWGGFAAHPEGHTDWRKGDDYSGDPAQEAQGLNSVYVHDTSTLSVIAGAVEKLQ